MSVILPRDSSLYRDFAEMITQRQIVMFAGLPGAGKSLLLQQLAMMAQEAGRIVHLLQWDVTRAAFETAVVLSKYPEVDGVTHALIRKCVGVWTRQGIKQWHDKYSGSEHILLGEVPLVGNRLIEVVQPCNDAAETILQSEQTLFVLPVPSRGVRRVIEAARERNSLHPQHEKERKDAVPIVLQMLWQEVADIGYQLNVITMAPKEKLAYDPELYTAVYCHLLRHRHYHVLPIDTVLQPSGSAYDLSIKGTEMAATLSEVDDIVQSIEAQYTPEALEQAVANWFNV